MRSVESYGNKVHLISVEKSPKGLKVQFEVSGVFGLTEKGEWILNQGTAIYQIADRTETTLRPLEETKRDVWVHSDFGEKGGDHAKLKVIRFIGPPLLRRRPQAEPAAAYWMNTVGPTINTKIELRF